MCALALTKRTRSPEAVFNAGHGVSISESPPVELDDTWTKWLGTLQTRQFNESKFIIVVRSRLGSFANDEGTTREIVERRAQLVHLCMLLSGVGYTGGMLKVCGHKRNGYLHVGPIQQLPALPFPGYRRHTRATIDTLTTAVRLAVRAERTYSSSYADRIRRGFKSIVLGWQSTFVDERLHYFVRAVEAVTKPGRKDITRIFCNRAQLFIGRSHANEQLLRELYDIRSCYEHTNDVTSATTKVRAVPKDHMLAYRSLQAEILASAVYQRIFEKPRLAARFSTQQGFDEFWAQPEYRRKRQWGSPVNLQTQGQKQFLNSEYDS